MTKCWWCPQILVAATSGRRLLMSSFRAIHANAAPEAIYCKACLLRSNSWMKLSFIKCAVDHFHEHQRTSPRLALRERFLNHSSIFLALSIRSPQLDFSHHYQCLVTTVDYAERPADLMKLNEWASPANTDANVFRRWQNGKSVIFNACCWAGAAKRQLSL